MIDISYELERQVIAHETNRNDAAGARAVLETLILTQMRQIADGLLADILLRGKSINSHAWWYQSLSRNSSPVRYLPDIKDPEFLSYRKDFAKKIATNQIKRIGLDSLPELRIRIFGGYCHFHDEGKINRQLIQLGSSLRLIVVGSSLFRTTRMKSMFGIRASEKTPVDGRFILGRIGPVSVFGDAALFLFEREFAISPYMEAMATGFTDEARIVVRQDIIRGEVEDQIQKFQAEKTRLEINDNEVERSIPFTAAQGMVRKKLETAGNTPPSMEELINEMTRGVLIHESAHILWDGARISSGTYGETAWIRAIREDLIRFAQQPRTLNEFRNVFIDYFPEGNALLRMGPLLQMPSSETYTIVGELDSLHADGLLFIDSQNRYYSKLYRKDERWNL